MSLRATSSASAAPGDARQQNGELIAAEPRYGIGLSHLIAHPRRDVPEQFIADVVTEGIVDGLEPVQIEIKQRQLVAFPARET